MSATLIESETLEQSGTAFLITYGYLFTYGLCYLGIILIA